MKKVLITGSNGFMGKNLSVELSRRGDVGVKGYDTDSNPDVLSSLVCEADFVFHLAGINRPQDDNGFMHGNLGLTKQIISILDESNKATPFLFTSSTQAELGNSYGISKKMSEDVVFNYGLKANVPVYVYRLTNAFGKWSLPNYNSVVSTFCHNIGHGLPISISDPEKQLDLIYIDDIVASFTNALDGSIADSHKILSVNPTYTITIAELAYKIAKLKDGKHTLVDSPDLTDEFTRKLHTTFLSYLPVDGF